VVKGFNVFINKRLISVLIMLKIKYGFKKALRVIKTIFIGMNYLAHAHLSFNEPHILVGNMISDFVKGKKQYDYVAGIQKGILLHRAIDHFTDTHPATQELKLFFKPQYRLYAGAFGDVVYDHFLATDTSEFATENDLKQFAHAVYETLEENFTHLPQDFKKILPHMTDHDWLYNYKNKWGIEKSFAGLVRRAKYISESAIAFDIFNTHYNDMKLIYYEFYPELKKFAYSQVEYLLNG
jgi:acyl carrier protein phosphodiesterase